MRYTLAQQEEACLMLLGMASYREVVEATGIPRDTLWRWMRERYGVLARRRVARRHDQSRWGKGWALVDGEARWVGY